jgi:hypothetical protein
VLTGKEFFKALKAADGSMVFLITGALKASLTNPANGKTITENLSGPFKQINFPDGSVTILGKDTSSPRSRQPIRRASGCLVSSSLRAR